MSYLNIKFIKAQMTALEDGTKTEEQVCQAIEAEVCRSIIHDRQEMQKERMHHDEFKRQYPASNIVNKNITVDEYLARLSDQDEDNNEDTTNEY
jgi:hypothetical protein